MKIEIEQAEYDKLKERIACLEGDTLIYKMKIEALTKKYEFIYKNASENLKNKVTFDRQFIPSFSDIFKALKR